MVRNKIQPVYLLSQLLYDLSFLILQSSFVENKEEARSLR